MEILIVESDPDVSCSITKALKSLVQLEVTASLEGALERVRSGRFPLVLLCGLGSSGWEALEFLNHVAASPNSPDVIFVPKNSSSEDLAIAALRLGVKDYIKDPTDLQQIFNSVAGWMRAHHRAFRPDLRSGRILGVSCAMTDVRNHIAKLASSTCNVLVTGETGTGKELVAEMIHSQSLRQHKPFMCINCAAVPDPLFESELFGYERGAFTGAASKRDGKLAGANGGTVFLDEVGDMTLTAQAKILRAIESREVHRLGGHNAIPLDVRLIAATNQQLETLVTTNHFRNDLYYRLNVARIYLLPLRERPEDIPGLLEHFLEAFRRKSSFPIEGFCTDAMNCLTEYSWPGNARELRNVIEYLFAMRLNALVRLADLPKFIVDQSTGKKSDSANDRDRLMNALRITAWNKTEAGKKLQWSRMTVYRKIAQFGIEQPPKIPSS